MENIEKKKVLSCIQPSGMLTLGNYIGALKNWVAMQNEFAKVQQSVPSNYWTAVEAFGTGVVQKEAFFIYSMGHQRYAYPRATFLYERDLKHLDDADEQTDKYVNFYLRQFDEIKDLIIEKTKITENEYNKHLKGQWWMSAEDAHKLRVCTEILYTTVLR